MNLHSSVPPHYTVLSLLQSSQSCYSFSHPHLLAQRVWSSPLPPLTQPHTHLPADREVKPSAHQSTGSHKESILSTLKVSEDG